MATIAQPSSVIRVPDVPVVGLAGAMAALVVVAFSFQLYMGRSTFASPWLTHAHALTFMGWIGIFLVQTTLGARGPLELHRRLGWLAAGWIVLMIAMGIAVTVAMVRRGTTPFFFRPQQFLVFDPVNVIVFALVSGWAIAWRRRTDWHARLHLSAMALLLGPAFGRLLPLPLLTPVAFESAALACAIFPIAGMIADKRRRGAVHPAWWCGLGALVAMIGVIEGVAYSPLGDALYRGTVAGSPGEARPGLEYPPPPAGPLITGR
jgi:hypothetical protein